MIVIYVSFVFPDSSESAETSSYFAAGDKCVDIVSALTRVHHFNVVEVLDDAILDQDAVTTEAFTRQGYDLTSVKGCLGFGASDLSHCDLWTVSSV